MGGIETELLEDDHRVCVWLLVAVLVADYARETPNIKFDSLFAGYPLDGFPTVIL